jgi:hypothetical protein
MIIEKHAGFPVLILSVSDVKPNATVNIQPAQAQQGAVAGVRTPSVQTEKVADGVFYIRGGTYDSVAVEFADHAAVIGRSTQSRHLHGYRKARSGHKSDRVGESD